MTVVISYKSTLGIERSSSCDLVHPAHEVLPWVHPEMPRGELESNLLDLADPLELVYREMSPCRGLRPDWPVTFHGIYLDQRHLGWVLYCLRIGYVLHGRVL